MVLQTTRIEIARSPAKVREVFLEFSTWPQWASSHFKSVDKLSPQKETIEKGDKLKVVMPGMTFNPTVLENNPSVFQWRGSLWGLLNGDHSFKFQPSETTPGGTTFVNEEKWHGPVLSLLRPIWAPSAEAPKGFVSFNEELKKRAESLSE
ncbi:hypothetical protein PRZ48_010470 [Zasmidium cellare]|uniref:Uncharacterized protein n=1 Tax=Zasmidium cellare TaxID=395010 RepID=A0ABR0E9D0_ZASCE|nr:hypothetical protein PRZ48_010470 [Zasmidium cellare]